MIAYWLVDQLSQQGVHHFCLAPGSRSSPLVLAAADHPKIKVHVHFDERGLGFFALGIAKGKNCPVALIVTSGTAVGNLFPSVMEAHHSHTPLIILSADRPHELRNCGANQTADQIKIFQPFVSWQTDLGLDIEEKTVRSIAAQAFFMSKQGPVHINCPFREPLYRELKADYGKAIEIKLPSLQIDSYKTKKARGVILVGRLPKSDDIHSVLSLAKKLKWPVLADILSNARCHPTKEQIKYFDFNEKPNPNFILHFGERMTSKKVIQWLKSTSAEYIHVSPWAELQDPERILTGRIQTDIDEFCKVFEAQLDPTWFELWKDQSPILKENGFFTEVHAMLKLAKLIPDNYAVFLGNGMPIRDGDHFLFPKKCKGFFANRGLSGIDGNIATVAGLAEEMPILGFIGDQAALYDLNSLALLKNTKHPILLIISNNFGGGIFHYLQVAKSPHFERLWAHNHRYRFQKIAEMFQIPYIPFDNLQNVFGQTAIVELITDRKQNFNYQDQCEEIFDGLARNTKPSKVTIKDCL